MAEASPVRFRIKGTGVYVEPVVRAKGSTAYEGASQAARVVRWRPATGGPNALLSYALPTLRARSRDVRRKDGLADSAIETIATEIVGTGIKPRFTTPDRDFNRQLTEDWLAWTDEADSDGRYDFYGLQALAVASMAEAGDVFTRLRVRRLEDGLTVPLQLQVLESEFCPDEKNERAPGGNLIRCGVEFDAIGRRAAYWLYRTHPNDRVFTDVVDVMPGRVPASEVVHMAAARRPGMIRGEPWLTRALVKLKDLDKFDDAQLVRQQIAALFAGFVTEEQPDTEGAENEIFGAQGDPDEDGVALASLEPGTMQVLGPGQKIEFSKPPELDDSYEAFMRMQQREVAVSAGILYESLTGDYGQLNDRQFRAAANQFRRRCAMWQHHLVVFQYCRPILQRWAELYALAGKKIPAGITPAMIARATWVTQGWPYLNPLQDAQAKQIDVRSGFKSRSQVVSEGGDDVEAVDAAIAADNERADELGLVFDSDPRKTASSGVIQDDSEEDEEKTTREAKP